MPHSEAIGSLPLTTEEKNELQAVSTLAGVLVTKERGEEIIKAVGMESSMPIARTGKPLTLPAIGKGNGTCRIAKHTKGWVLYLD